MAKNKVTLKKFIPVIVLVFLLSTLSFVIGSVTFLDNSPVVDSLEKTGIVHVAIQRGEGSIYGEGYEDVGHFENIVVDIGLNSTRDLIGQGVSIGTFNIIGLANGTTAVATDSSAPTEWTANGLSRKLGDYNTISDSAGNWTISTTFTSTTIAGLNVNKTCLFNSTTVAGSTMFSCVNFDELTLDGTAGDTLLINWTNTVTSG